jgi:hypothetical protein
MDASRIPAEISSVLATLRERIRRYVLIEGAALLIALLAGLFWFSFTADVAWFQISKLELPLWFRWGFTTIACALVAAAAASWLVFRLVKSFRTRALALVLERRFPQLDDRLVTAVELADDDKVNRQGLSGAMLERTVADASRLVSQLDLGSVFDSRPLRRAVLAAVLLAGSVLGLGVANAGAMKRWYHAYIAGQENYWDPYRRSELTIQVVAQPGDRIREFDAEHRYKHARGADLTVLVTVREGKQVPPSVTLRHRSYGAAGTTRGAVSMSRVGERQFRHTIGRVIDPHELWVVGGDFTNRDPLVVDVVDPPKVDRIELLPDYPTYTGMDGLEDRPVVVQGARVSLPMETKFVLKAAANKPLVGVQVRSERFVLDLNLPREGSSNAQESWLTLAAPDASESRRLPIPPAVAAKLLGSDRKSLEWPLHLSAHAIKQLDELYGAAATASGPIEIPSPFPLPPDQQLQIYLEDLDEILSFDPASVTIAAIPDLPPVIDVRLTGIGNRITRLASIPVQGKLTDDYGVSEAWFGFQRPGEEQRREPLKNPPRGRTAIELERAPGEKVERLDVTPLQLDVGNRLELALFARDGDVLNGPHEASGPVFAFEIVSNEALLGDLYDKEMNLRLRFEHIREEVDALRTDLLLHRGRYTDGEKLKKAAPEGRTAADVREELRQIGIALQACGARSLHLIRKDHAETREVEARFRDIREELVNNRVDTQDKLTRLDGGILKPLAQLTVRDFPAADELLGLLSLTLEREQDPTAVIDDSVSALDRMLVLMDRILEQMQQRRGFNEMIQELQGLVDRQKQILEQTEQERQRSVIDDLFNP